VLAARRRAPRPRLARRVQPSAHGARRHRLHAPSAPVRKAHAHRPPPPCWQACPRLGATFNPTSSSILAPLRRGVFVR
jgi:hypothetical protein